MPALAPDPKRMATQKGLDSPGIVARQRLTRRQFPQPLNGERDRGPLRKTYLPPERQVFDRGPDERRSGYVVFVSAEEGLQRRGPSPLLVQNEPLGPEGLLDLLKVGGGAGFKQLIEAQVPLLDFVDRRRLRFRQSPETVQKPFRPCRYVADTEK